MDLRKIMQLSQTGPVTFEINQPFTKIYFNYA